MKKFRIKPTSKTIRDKRGRSLGTVRINSRGGVTIRTKPPSQCLESCGFGFSASSRVSIVR